MSLPRSSCAALGCCLLSLLTVLAPSAAGCAPYTEFGLSLAAVARRLEVSPRQLSDAVNRVHGRRFRTLLNDWRVDAAARLLEDPGQAGKAIAEVMFDAGFQAKSSFNKEFALRKGVPPGEHRQGRRSGPARQTTGDVGG
jgi:AraC-like DNA-binding protein